jgi:hypothetical protein
MTISLGIHEDSWSVRISTLTDHPGCDERDTSKEASKEAVQEPKSVLTDMTCTLHILIGDEQDA